MTQSVFQIDHDQVKTMITQTSNMANEWQKWYDKLISQTEILKASWLGDAGVAFGNEMDEVVNPAFKRLYEGLNHVSENLKKLDDLWDGVDQQLIGSAHNIDA